MQCFNASDFLHLTTCCQIQVHIVQRGAVRPLIRMLEATDTQLREMAAFALGRLAQVLINHMRSWPREHRHSLKCIISVFMQRLV